MARMAHAAHLLLKQLRHAHLELGVHGMLGQLELAARRRTHLLLRVATHELRALALHDETR